MMFLLVVRAANIPPLHAAFRTAWLLIHVITNQHKISFLWKESRSQLLKGMPELIFKLCELEIKKKRKRSLFFHLNLPTLLPGNDAKALRYISVSEVSEWSQRSQRCHFSQDGYHHRAMQVFCAGHPLVILVPFEGGCRILYKRNDTSCLYLSTIFPLFPVAHTCLGWDEVSCWFYSQPQWTTEFLMESCWPPQMQSSMKAANTRSPTNTH